MFTTEQIQSLKAVAAADPTASVLMSGAKDVELAAWFNGVSTFVLWNSQTSMLDIYNSVVWASLTPTDAADGTATWTNRALQCQAKQINLQIMLQGQNKVDATRSNIRAGLQDALTNVPSGASGATLSAGWVPVRDVMKRFATVAEKTLATGTGSDASPGIATWEGKMSYSDASNIRSA